MKQASKQVNDQDFRPQRARNGHTTQQVESPNVVSQWLLEHDCSIGLKFVLFIVIRRNSRSHNRSHRFSCLPHASKTTDLNQSSPVNQHIKGPSSQPSTPASHSIP